MSADKSAQSIKNLTESHTESDKTQSTASNETSSVTITTVGDDKKDTPPPSLIPTDSTTVESSKMKLDNLTSDSSATGSSRMTIPESASDFNQWLQSMLAVARLPGGLPIEFRRKLWLALAERYLKHRGVDWEMEKVKWLSEKSRADDEELGIQIVKDLHRTGHSLLSGASGQIYQAKLKRILMGYTRWNPEVGYCQGFNMLGAIILQVMDKSEVDSIKVMIFLIEGLLPNGYFCGSLMGLQADMAVFRELLGYKLPKLARHLQKLQSSTNEPSFEPPIINVFTMQWFLTLFCNCLPMNYVLRIWDLIMIEGSDILLRCALSIWKVLEDRILREVRTADDFYCKMEALSGELLNGTLIDANRLIHMISTLGPINDLNNLRQKHLTASYNDQKQLKMLYSNAESDESRIAVANAWASRRGSQPTVVRGQSDREKIALDITILKKQYDKLRERQKQAHIILSSAVSKQNQQHQKPGPSQVNKLLVGKNAIVSKGRKGPPKGSIPPVRNQKLVKSSKAPLKQTKPEETLQWNNTDEAKKRRNSVTWKELNAERRTDETPKTMSKSSSASSLGSGTGKVVDMASPKRRSDSSSYSEDSEGESSSTTSLCDDEIISSLEASPMKKKRHKDLLPLDVSKKTLSMKTIEETSPVAIDTKDCPVVISVSEVDKGPSPMGSFYLDLPKSLDTGDITSISQLSPMPDLSSYFTAISPITTPCDFFEFPDLSSFIMSSNDKFQVSDEGVTNEFFERVFEENLNFAPSPDTTSIMSKSFSPSILKRYDATPPEETSPSRYMKQKSLSMDEHTIDKEEVIAINRSFSDGTIITADTSVDFKKIIAENSKILNKLIPRTFDSPDGGLKLKIESTIVEEPKTPCNLSDVEDEIAAIDKADDADEAREDVLLSDIQDLANIDAYLSQRDASLPCNTHSNNTKDENVTERGKGEDEKSISECGALATLACSPFENKALEAPEIKALTVSDVPAKVEARREDIKIESPKFNEIQLMVTKLQEEMESQLKSEVVVQEERAVQDKIEQDKIVQERAMQDKIALEKVTQEKEALEKAKQIKPVHSEPSETNVTEVKIVISHAECDEKPADEPIKDPPVVVDPPKSTVPAEPAKAINECPKKASNTSGDLEKMSSEKIDNDSDTILHKLNTQLEMCQKTQSKEVLSDKSKKLDDCKTETANLEGKYEHEAKASKDDAKSLARESTSDVVKPETKKDSNVILENLNMQLQRYEESGSKLSDKSVPMTYETSAVMELATMIKERELEKLSEQKQLMKTSKDIDFDFDLSPVRKSHSKSNISSPEPTKYNNYFYDHEPRNETRRRDIHTLETDQRCRRQFKSSPTSSLSSSPSNIATCLSSIQNTIKILDSACQNQDATVVYKKLDRAMESVEKICDTDKDWKYYKKNKYESSPSFKIDDVTFESHSKRQTLLIDDEKRTEKSFDLSPRRKRYDFDVDDRSFRSPSKEVSPARFTPKTPEIDPDYVAKLRYLSTEQYIAGRKSPLSGSRENLSTKFKIDRSPTSPTLSTSTHFSRPPRSPSHSSSLLRFPPSDNRNSKSAETSPSRYSGERVETSIKYNNTSSSADLRAESMSNLSCKSSKTYEYDWEKPTASRKYDFY